MTDAVHTPVHMSPAQAAQAAGVSRWTIMRAIKTQELKAIRDNRNHWLIAAEDFDRWRTSTVRTVEVLHTPHTPDAIEMERLKAEVETERRLREAAEADRDHWREMANKLAAPIRRRWWPWKQ